MSRLAYDPYGSSPGPPVVSTDPRGAREEDVPGQDEELTIQQVSRLLDIPAPTIRSWERRYGVPLAGRSQGGHRRYAADQLELLRHLRDAIAQGHRAAEAAAQVLKLDAVSPPHLVESLLLAAQNLQPARIGELLDSACEALGLDSTVDEVVLPAMRQIGLQWRSGRTDVSHEHLATHATQVWLSKIARTGPPLLEHHPIILSCGPRDQHTLGLEAIGALLRQRGWDCRMLGARTPAESLARAVRETEASAVVLVCHLLPGRAAAIESLSSTQLRHTQIFYAGGAFASRQARHGVPGRYLGNSMHEAADFITATLMGIIGPDQKPRS